jgi:hypothetical protein
MAVIPEDDPHDECTNDDLRPAVVKTRKKKRTRKRQKTRPRKWES